MDRKSHDEKQDPNIAQSPRLQAYMLLHKLSSGLFEDISNH